MKYIKRIFCAAILGHLFIEQVEGNRPYDFKCRTCGVVLAWYWWATWQKLRLRARIKQSIFGSYAFEGKYNV